MSRKRWPSRRAMKKDPDASVELGRGSGLPRVVLFSRVEILVRARTRRASALRGSRRLAGATVSRDFRKHLDCVLFSTPTASTRQTRGGSDDGALEKVRAPRLFSTRSRSASANGNSARLFNFHPSLRDHEACASRAPWSPASDPGRREDLRAGTRRYRFGQRRPRAHARIGRVL